MSNIALPVSAIEDVVDVLRTLPLYSEVPAASTVQVYESRAPQGAVAPFVNVAPLSAQRFGVGLATEDWGKLAATYQMSCFGASPAQADALRNQVLGLAWGDQWALPSAPTLPVPFEDVTDDPTQWATVVDIVEVDTGTPVDVTVRTTGTGPRTIDAAGTERTWNP